jgi:hypothetical protein
MRRFFTIGVVVMIAAAFFGCAEQALEEDAPKYDEQGRRLVTFSVSTDMVEARSTRALTKPIAQVAWDYVEVIFTDGTTYYFGAASRGENIRFSLPEADGYKAVMLVGIANGNRLLGVGVPDDAAGTDGLGGINIAVNTTAIEFTVTALTADIGATGTPGDLTLNSINTPEANFDMDGALVPYFKLIKNTTDITGTLTIRGFPAEVGGTKLVDVSGAPTAITVDTPVYIGVAETATRLMVTPGDGTNGTTAPTASMNGTSGELEINFKLAVSTDGEFDEGFSRLRLGASVKAFGANGNGSVWNVSNGLENAYDFGANSIGRDILFYVGTLTDTEGSVADNTRVVTHLDLTSWVPAPSFDEHDVGEKPVMSFDEDQYTGTVIWDPSHDFFTSTSVRYTATVILRAKENFTFIDPADDKLVEFIHGGLDAPSGGKWIAGSISTQGNSAGVTVTIKFPSTLPVPVETVPPENGDEGPTTSLNLDLTNYIPAPGVGKNLTMFFSPPLDTYTVKSITWSPLDNPAVGGVEYTAKAIMTVKPGYTFEGVDFAHADTTTIINDHNSNEETITVTLTFPKAITTTYVYAAINSFSNGTMVYDSVLDMINVNKSYTYLFLTLGYANSYLVAADAKNATDFGLGIEFTHGTGGNCPANLIFNGGERSLGLAPTGKPAITVGKGVTLTLQNIIFKGNNRPTAYPYIKVADGGTLILETGAAIESGSANNPNKNTASDGGGVYVEAGGTLIMKDGTINSGIATVGNGGGVYVEDGGTFTMSGGTIYGSTAGGNGGGVYVEAGGTFTMSGGRIYSNTTTGNGGGVFVETSGTFIKTGGTIEGNNNAATGKVAYVEGGGNKKRETTAGPTDNLDSTKDGPAGGWGL